MGNIVGDNPRRQIVDQINIRQGVLGLDNKSSEVLAWQANQTPFIRVTSCVSISKEKSVELTGMENYAGMALAREFVLLGGIWSQNKDTPDQNNLGALKSGVTNLNPNPIINKFAYGFGGTSFGLQPPPGIISLDVDSLSRGSLKKSTLKLRVNSHEQLKIVEALYLRLGYTILIEYGHSVYINNKGEYIPFDGLTLPYRKVLLEDEGTNNQHEINSSIDEQRLNSNGNYDGFLGKITNFKWGISDAGFYDVEVSIISVGDVAESFKMNIGAPLAEAILKSQTTEITDFKEFPVFDESKTKLNSFLTSIKTALESKITKSPIPIYKPSNIEKTTGVEYTTLLSIDKGKTQNLNHFYSPYYTYQDMIDVKLPLPKEEDKNYNAKLIDYKAFWAEFSIFQNSIQPYWAVKSNSKVYSYITLRQFLRFIESELLAYNKDESGNLVPLFRIDTRIDNFCYTNPYQLSLNPEICLIPFTNPFDRELGENTLQDKKSKKEILEFSGVPFYQELNYSRFRSPILITNDPNYDYAAPVTSKYVGSLLDVLVNVDFIQSILKDAITGNNKTDISLYDLLSQTMSGIQLSLGNVNKFDVTFENEDQTITITDTIPLSSYLSEESGGESQEADDNVALFNIYGNSPNNGAGSFVYDMSFQATISKAMSSMITVGSQSGGNGGIANSTAFSTWNQGLIDITMPKKQTVELTKEETQLQQKQDDEKEKELNASNPFYYGSNQKDGIIGPYQNYKKYCIDPLIKYFYFPPSKTKLTNDILSNIGEQGSNWQTLVTGYYPSINPNAPNPNGFIPLTLSLSMLGLGGVKIYDRIFVNKEILPPNYPKNLAFIIKGMKHKIDNKGWKTDLDCFSFSVPKNLVLPSLDGTNNKYLKSRSQSSTF